MISAFLTTLALLSPPQSPEPIPAAPTQPRPTPKIEQPAALAPVADVASNARLFPPDTLVVISALPFAEHEKALAQTGFARLFKPSLQAFARGHSMKQFEALGLPAFDVRELLRHGFTAGLTGVDAMRPHWLVVSNLGTKETELRAQEMTARLTKHHEVLQSRGARMDSSRMQDVEVWAIQLADKSTFAWAVHDGKLFLANTATGIRKALKKLSDPTAKSLATSAAYRRFATRCHEEGKPFFTTFIQPQPVLQKVLASIPRDMQERINRLSEQLDLLNVSELGFSLFAVKGEVRDLGWIGYPKPIRGFLRALAKGERGVAPDQHRFVSPDVVSVTFSSVNWTEVYKSGLSLIRSFDPSVPQSMLKAFDTLRTDAQVDVLIDILGNLGDQVAIAEWQSPTGNFGSWGLTIQVKDGEVTRRAMLNLAKHLGMKQTTLNGEPAIELPTETINLPGKSKSANGILVVAHGRIIIGNSPVVARQMLKALANKPGHPRVKAAVDSLESRPVSMSWADCARYGDQVLRSLSVQWGNKEVAQGIARTLEEIGGDLVATVKMSESGISFQSRSPYGNLYLSLTAAYFLNSEFHRLSGVDTLSPTEQVAMRQANLLGEIATAQQAFRDSLGEDEDKDGKGEFASLTTLLNRSFLDKERFGKTEFPDTYRVDSYLFRTYLPKTPDLREESVLTFAWPASNKTGIVFALDEKGRIHNNQILAHVEGLAACEPRDFYVRGVFGAPIKSGWKNQELDTQRSALMADLPQASLSDDQKRAFSQIEMAEAGGSAPAEVILFLESDNAMVAARAAHAMGRLKCEEAVTQLCKLVNSHKSVLVRRQAMAALKLIRDRRSKTASIRALESTDSTLRALAAQNLGALQIKESKDKLLEVLSISSEKDSPDRIAAIVALADLGDPSALIAAATSAKEPGPEEEKALVYLFQTLSPTLENIDETETLITVLSNESELLRRYAIQRLGVLKNPAAAKPLEGRLAVETTLQDLVKVSLDSVRGTAPETKGDLVATAKRQANHLWKQSSSWWGKATEVERYSVLGGAGLFLVLIIVWRIVARRRRHQRDGDAMIAMIAQSDDFEEDQEEEYDDYANYDEDADYDDGYGEEGDYADDDVNDYDAPVTGDFDVDDSEEFVDLESGSEYDDWDEAESEDEATTRR